MKILIINGPNLNLLGTREPDKYGNKTFEDYLDGLRKKFNNYTIDYFQSNHEGDIVDKLHEAGFVSDGIIINAGAYTHTSVAIGDAIRAISTPVVEVHISNIAARESFRHQSYLSAPCSGTIFGMGLVGYQLAIQYFEENNR